MLSPRFVFLPFERSLERFFHVSSASLAVDRVADSVRLTSAHGIAMRNASTDNAQPAPRTHLFTVRVWLEELGTGQTEWRGQVQYVVSGEVHYFREWPALVALLQAMLPKKES